MDDELRKRLIEEETLDEQRERRFREELGRMIHKSLTTRQRIGYGIGILAGLISAAFLSYAAWAAPSDLPAAGRLAFVAGIVASLLWAAYSAYIVAKGTFDRRTDENRLQGLLWVFMVLMMGFFLMVGGQSPDRVRSVYLVLYGLVFFVIFAIPAFVSLRINRLEFGLREQLLRMEITLAEMAARHANRPAEPEEKER